MIIPFAFMYDLGFLLQAGWFQNLFALLAGLVSAMSLSYALEGFLKTKLNIPMRMLFAAVGILVLFPNTLIRTIFIIAFIALYSSFQLKKKTI